MALGVSKQTIFSLIVQFKCLNKRKTAQKYTIPLRIDIPKAESPDNFQERGKVEKKQLQFRNILCFLWLRNVMHQNIKVIVQKM